MRTHVHDANRYHRDLPIAHLSGSPALPYETECVGSSERSLFIFLLCSVMLDLLILLLCVLLL